MSEARKFMTPEQFALEYEGLYYELVYGTPQVMARSEERRVGKECW